MELLKFNDAPKSARRGKNPAGFIGAGIMVAVMGLSSTLAGTISINTGQAIEFGQGVVNAAACDSSIKVTPTSSFNGDTFTISALTLEDIGYETGGTNGDGCRNVALEIRVFNSTDSTTALTTRSSGGTNYQAITLYIPSGVVAGSGALGVSNDATYFARHYVINETGTITTTELGGSVSAAGSVLGNTNATGTSALKFVISGLSISASAARITVESRAARDEEKD